MSTCDSTFSTIHGWNFHHSYVHKNIILKCETCNRKFTSPSAHHAHKSAHASQNHICTICSKAFPFKSGLRQHVTVHIKQKHHRCFAGNCKRSYKWASDLNRHVKMHVVRKHQCPTVIICQGKSTCINVILKNILMNSNIDVLTVRQSGPPHLEGIQSVVKLNT